MLNSDTFIKRSGHQVGFLDAAAGRLDFGHWQARFHPEFFFVDDVSPGSGGTQQPGFIFGFDVATGLGGVIGLHPGSLGLNDLVV